MVHSKLFVFALFVAFVFAGPQNVQSKNVIAKHVENYADGVAETCYICESKVDNIEDDCIYQPIKSKNCTTKGYCYMHVSDEGVFRRGCVSDSDRFVRNPEQCKDSEKCSVCSDKNNCNNKQLEVERCFESEYKMENPIPRNELVSIACRVYFEAVGCYHLEINGTITKGCMTNLIKSKQEEYKSSSDCDICNGKNCNLNVVRNRTCVHCNEKTGTNCAEPSEATEEMDVSRLSSSCLVGIDENGYSKRMWGTNKTHDSKRYPKGFELCYNNSCNNIIYPSDRLKCVQCHGDENCGLTTDEQRNKLFPTVCEIYDKTDQCFTLSNDGKIYRGCMSDKSDSQSLCKKEEDNCTKCNESGCNDQSNSAGDTIFRQISITILLITSTTLGVLRMVTLV